MLDRHQPLILFDEPAWKSLRSAVEKGRPDPLAWFRLRTEAEEIALSPGFEELLGLDLNLIDEYPHQIEAALTVLRRMRGRALLADEVGLGKTIEAGLVMKELLLRGLARKVLVLVPASLTVQWQEEMETKFGESFVINRAEEGWEEHQRLIGSLDTAKRPNHARRIEAVEWDLLIVDEAHKLRNHRTQLWRFMNRLRKRYVLFLTATPVHNDLRELYNLITVLKPGLLGTYPQFRKQFIQPGEDRRRAKSRARLKTLLRDVMIRNRRGHISVKFPPRHAYTVTVDLSREERDLYESVSEVLREQARAGESARRGTAGLRLVTMQEQLCSSPFAIASALERMAQRERDPWQKLAIKARGITSCGKIDSTVLIIAEAQDKALVFTDYRSTQEQLLSRLDAEGIPAVAFHGGLSPRAKEQAVEMFRENATVLVSTESGAEGRNLQFCNVMINYDLPWNPMKLEQRIGRIHRLGQQREVFVFNLAAKGTIEERILDLLTRKIRMFELVIGELDLILGQMEGGATFETTLRRIWLESASNKAMTESLDDFGDRLVKARNRFAGIRDAELIVSQIFQ